MFIVIALSFSMLVMWNVVCSETGSVVSGYGVLCEVFEAGTETGVDERTAMTYKARATQRFRLTRLPKLSVPMHAFSRYR